MATSQNGYKANDYSLIATYTVTRDVKISLRKGDASVVLLHFARWYDQNIEPLTKADTGGYNPRTIEGSTQLSNHASGTAEDLRWNKHALGRVGTFTSTQVFKIHAQLKFYNGVIRWGGDYTGRKDEMHFEINKGLAELAAAAQKCRVADGTGSVPVPPPKPPTHPGLVVDGRLGSLTIGRWQSIMHTPVDGEISKPKSDLIKAVQTKLKGTVNHNLQVDGEFGPKTIVALQKYLRSPADGFISKPKSQVVMALQRRLNTGKF